MIMSTLSPGKGIGDAFRVRVDVKYDNCWLQIN